RVVALRPAPGQADASRLLLSLLKGSDLLKAKKPRRVQDPLSFRCLAPVNGAAFEQLARSSPAAPPALPRFLPPRSAGARTGFATVQKATSALEAEIRHLALPLGAMTAPVADGVEDYAPMTPRVVEKPHEIV